MSSVTAHQAVKALQIEAKVLRCTCTPKQREAADFHGTLGEPCPNPRTEDLGVIVKWARRLARIGKG